MHPPVKRRGLRRVEWTMSDKRKTILLVAGLLCAGACTLQLARPALASEFTTFAADEDVCRRVGAAAIQGATGPSAVQRYDYAHAKCMMAHSRMRQFGADNGPPGYSAGNPHSFEYPDAFYSIPYATPGYGYDGFSY